ncbi:MAG: hypothetical protein JOY90_26130 [Bradyrhizobium sp.]|uniref:hypothetical protein n=1 Tax=Bradyrhizobium sp. TaxID=376 RepID=UPI001DEC8300|nr:hypothetical protein [Bradyrhizobium sp.]MBV9563893.1 hypothetical protein [Bradyrhizobium sp.]
MTKPAASAGRTGNHRCRESGSIKDTASFLAYLLKLSRAAWWLRTKVRFFTHEASVQRIEGTPQNTESGFDQPDLS